MQRDLSWTPPIMKIDVIFLLTGIPYFLTHLMLETYIGTANVLKKVVPSLTMQIEPPEKTKAAVLVGLRKSGKKAEKMSKKVHIPKMQKVELESARAEPETFGIMQGHSIPFALR